MRKFFEGWYFKQQNDKEVLAFIIGVQYDNNENGSCFIQVVNGANSYNFDFDLKDYSYDKKKFIIKIGKNVFSKNGIDINIETSEVKIKGKLNYKNLSLLKYNIMGPFKYFPFMECKHGVVSSHHKVNGNIFINDNAYSFNDNDGYIEKDSGHSFPTSYFWSHCYSPTKNIMALVSVATISYLGLKFNGFFCVVNMLGKEYRLATYLSGRIEKFEKNKIKLKQGKYIFEAEVLAVNEQKLKAPNQGEMTREVLESAKGKVRYILYTKKETICDFTCDSASSEYVKKA